MKKQNGVLTLILGMLMCAGTACRQSAPPPVDDTWTVGEWLAARSVPLAAVEAGAGFADLEPLKDVLGEARIVALGEATHGTREFFQFKHRMLEFLVKEMGFTAFLIESSYPACLNINDYVLHGRGDRDEALAGQGFWTWNTEEVAAMIEWMHQYNLTVPDEKKVRFFGFDIQVLQKARQDLSAYIGRHAPAYLERYREIIAPFEEFSRNRMQYSKMPAEEKNKISRGMLEINGFLSFNRGRFIRQSSESEFERALQYGRVLYQAHDAYSRPLFDRENPSRTGGFYRDLYMAENIASILERECPGAKAVVWAHNSHIAKAPVRGGLLQTGCYLKEYFGDEYYALGFVFNQGSFQAINMDTEDGRPRGLMEHTVGPAQEGLIGRDFALAGIGDFIIDFRSAPQAGPVADWLTAARPIRSIGSGFAASAADNFRMEITPREHYDGMVFIESTTRARPNQKKKSPDEKSD